MKTILPIFAAIVALYFSGCQRTTTESLWKPDFIEPLRPYVTQIARETDKIATDRRALLDAIATTVTTRITNGQDATMTFICTHNSRRSQMSQIWAEVAAYYYGLGRVHALSGGTETAACNCRTVAAMRRIGFSIVQTSEGNNPIYLVQYSDYCPPVRAYSKLYNADDNPKRDFIALMTCSQADKKCPIVEGSIARYAIHYADPKLCDDTLDEASAYDSRCREIAREIFYIMSEVRKSVDRITTKQSAPGRMHEARLDGARTSQGPRE